MTASSGLTLIDLTLAGGMAQGSNGQDGPADGVSGIKGEDAYGGAIDSVGGDVVLDGVAFDDTVPSNKNRLCRTRYADFADSADLGF